MVCVVCGLDHFNCALTAISSSSLPVLEPVFSVITDHDTPSEKPLSCMPTIRELVCVRLFCLVSDKYPWTKCKVTVKGANKAAFQRLMTYLCDREAVAMIDNNYENRIGLLVPHMESIGEWYFSRMDQLTLWRKVLAKKRITTEAEAETARIAMEAEAARIATEAEAARIAAEAEASRRSPAPSASAHCPVQQSPECKQAERKDTSFG